MSPGPRQQPTACPLQPGLGALGGGDLLGVGEGNLGRVGEDPALGGATSRPVLEAL